MVSANTTADGFLTISTVAQIANNKLDIRPNGSNLFNMIGLTIYSLDQSIIHPEGSIGVGFANSIKYSPETATLIISSTADRVIYQSEIDTGKTTYDNRSTRVIDSVNSAGSVYVYELLYDKDTGISNTGLMSYVQRIQSSSLKPNDGFGQSIDINKDLILIGAPGTDTPAVNAGSVYAYTNIEQVQSWNIIRSREPRVDVNNINKIFIYDIQSNVIKTSLDVIDPVKGKILGIVEQSLDYKTSLDPAVYNSGNNETVAFNNGYHWNERQVGKIWWNLNDLRYIDYEQGDLIYRTKNWGKIFPGSTVQVCEWIESKYPPAQYVANGGDGQPVYRDAFNIVNTVINGVITPKYYYWVTRKQSAAPGKKYSVSLLADIIENPQLQNVPYAGMLKSNAISLVGIQQYLNDAYSALHIDYQEIVNENSVHTEYELVNENQPNINIPSRIVDKIIDSLSGIDAVGQVVPDPALRPSEKIGLGIRPLQTLIIEIGRAHV